MFLFAQVPPAPSATRKLRRRDPIPSAPRTAPSDSHGANATHAPTPRRTSLPWSSSHTDVLPPAPFGVRGRSSSDVTPHVPRPPSVASRNRSASASSIPPATGVATLSGAPMGALQAPHSVASILCSATPPSVSSSEAASGASSSLRSPVVGSTSPLLSSSDRRRSHAALPNPLPLSASGVKPRADRAKSAPTSGGASPRALCLNSLASALPTQLLPSSLSTSPILLPQPLPAGLYPPAFTEPASLSASLATGLQGGVHVSQLQLQPLAGTGSSGPQTHPHLGMFDGQGAPFTDLPQFPLPSPTSGFTPLTTPTGSTNGVTFSTAAASTTLVGAAVDPIPPRNPKAFTFPPNLPPLPPPAPAAPRPG